MNWVRVYSDILDDKKIDKITPKSFKFFIFLLVFLSSDDQNDIQNGIIKNYKDTLAWRFRWSKKAVEKAIHELIELDIISIKNNELLINNWVKRQYKSDNSTERVKRFRERFRNVSETPSETPPETETETETETYKEKNIKKKKVAKISDDDFETFWSFYPQRFGSNNKQEAFKQWNARLKEGHSADEMINGVKQYQLYCTAADKAGTEFVKMAATFLGHNKHFLDNWEQKHETTTQTRQNNTTDAASYIRDLSTLAEEFAG